MWFTIISASKILVGSKIIWQTPRTQPYGITKHGEAMPKFPETRLILPLQLPPSNSASMSLGHPKWLELSLNTPSMSLRHYVFTAPKYVFTALFHADPEVLFLICIYGITKYGGAMPKFPEPRLILPLQLPPSISASMSLGHPQYVFRALKCDWNCR